MVRAEDITLTPYKTDINKAHVHFSDGTLIGSLYFPDYQEDIELNISGYSGSRKLYISKQSDVSRRVATILNTEYAVHLPKRILGAMRTIELINPTSMPTLSTNTRFNRIGHTKE